MDRELLQDSDGVNESFWDGLGVEFEAKYIFDFKGAPRGGSARDGGTRGSPGRGDTGGSGPGGHGGSPGREDTGVPPPLFMGRGPGVPGSRERCAY